MKKRMNVSFYSVFNGHSEFIGTGVEYTLGNGSQFAVIGDERFRIVFDGVNNTSYRAL